MLGDQVYVKAENGKVKTRDFKVKGWSEFTPFLKWENRKEWEELDAPLRKIILDAAKEYRKLEYPALKATDFMEYYRSGSRVAYETPYFIRRHALSTLVLAYCLEPDEIRLDQIINGIWCICEESTWAVPAHNFIYEPELINGERTLPDGDLPILDIFTGETGMLLSMTYYLLKEELDRVEPLVCKRIQSEVRKRVVEPFLSRYDYWWMGYSDRRDINNWGPWCVMNCVISTLFCETEDSRRKRAIVRSMDMMEYYLKGIKPDGGCDEGATYWGRACGMLLEGLNLIYEATDGEVSAYEEEKLVNFTDYIRKLYIGGDYVVNFADGSARCNPAAEIIYTAGSRMKSQRLMDFGAYCYEYQLQKGIFPILSLSRAMASIQKHKEMMEAAGEARFEREDYIDSLEIMAARQYEAAGQGLFLCIKGGSNGDSHNHNDVGNFVCYYDGNPILVDVGVETYRKESFGSGRYNIWTMQSQYHNLPTIDGIMQKEGGEYCSGNVKHISEVTCSSFACDLQGAYPGLREGYRYRRCLELNREEGQVILTEAVDALELSDVEFHYMTPCKTIIESDGIRFLLNKGDVIMKFETAAFDIQTETINLTDKKLVDSWGNYIYRLILSCKIKKADFVFEISKA